MYTRLIRSCLVAVLAVAVFGMSNAHAGDDENNSGVGPFTKSNYPGDIIDRPLTLVGGMLQLGIAVVHQSISIAGLGSADSTGMGFSAAYGLGNKIEVGVATGLGIDPNFEWRESLAVSVGYLAVDQKQLDVRANIGTTLNFVDGADLFSGVALGASTRFKINNMLALTGGHNLIRITTSDPSQVDLDMNFGVLAQVVPNVALSVDTQLASIGVVGDNNSTTHIGEFIPVLIRAFYTADTNLDIGAFVDFPNVEDAGDFFTASIVARYRM